MAVGWDSAEPKQLERGERGCAGSLRVRVALGGRATPVQGSWTHSLPATGAKRAEEGLRTRLGRGVWVRGCLRWWGPATTLFHTRSLPHSTSPHQAAVNNTTDADLPPDTLQYATCLWTRDVSNVALALFTAGEVAPAARAVRALAALYSRADHAAVMDKMTAAQGAGYDNFTCAPVRFHAASGDRTDPWAHQQLDALGLFLTAYGTLCTAGHVTPDLALISRFVRYLDAIQYWQRPDLGHWEEWPPLVRTSSVGCCVAGLQACAPLFEAAAAQNGGVGADAAHTNGVAGSIARSSSTGRTLGDSGAGGSVTARDVLALADKGWAVLQTRLGRPPPDSDGGGEARMSGGGGEGRNSEGGQWHPSDGDAWEAPGRKDDAAMLTLLLPPVARQLGLTTWQREALAASALRLRRPHGVLRYERDSYYGADYQQRLRSWKAHHTDGDPAAYPHATVRDSWALEGCEAQWTIFEPLLLLHFLHVHSTCPRPGPPGSPQGCAESAGDVRRSLMRILAAIEEEPAAPPPKRSSSLNGTGSGSFFDDTPEDTSQAAAPQPPPKVQCAGELTDVRLHVHESYTVVTGRRGPNDVQDLLWAVAYIRMALAVLAGHLGSGGCFH